MKKRTLILIVLVVIAAGAFHAYREWNRGLPQADEAQPAETLTATALFTAFTTDEAAANARFNDKLLQVSGTVREVNGGGDAPVNVWLETGDPLAAVVCEFPAEAMVVAQSGSSLTVKGFCAGYNMDVQLQRCAIVE